METASSVSTKETPRNSEDSLPLPTRLLKETETMDPYKKYIMGQPKYRSRSSTRASRGDKKKVSPRARKSGLQELDETVASVEKSQRSSSRRSRADESSVGSYTIATREGNSIYEHKNLIDNLQMMKKVGSTSELKQSKSTYSKRSRRSRTSRRSNRTSLERVVTDTILDSATWGGANFITTREEELSSKKLSAESILEDLDQASAIIESELRSTRSIRSSSRSTYSRKKRGSTGTTHQDPRPICSIAEDNILANSDVGEEDTKKSILNTSTDVVVLGKTHQRPVRVTTPETSASSSYDAEPDKCIPATQIAQEDNSWPDVFEGLDHGKSSPVWSTTVSSSNSNSMFDPYNMDAFITQEWTNFDANPFFNNSTSSSDQEHNSTDSPNSIVYLGSNKKKNRSKTAPRQRDETISTKMSV